MVNMPEAAMHGHRTDAKRSRAWPGWIAIITTVVLLGASGLNPQVTIAGGLHLDRRPALASITTNLVANGDFEMPLVTWITTYYAGSTLAGWTVSAGSIDLIPDVYWQAASGTQSVDLSGFVAGTLSQTVPTAMGSAYLLRFAMAGNPDGGPALKRMNVEWGSTVVATPSFNITGQSRSNMGWTYYADALSASDNATTLQFQSLTSGMYGPAVDDVSVITQTANLTVSPTSGFDKESVVITGTAFTPNETVNIYEDVTTTAPIYTAIAGADGSFVLPITVQPGTYGNHVLIAQGQSSNLFGATNFFITPRLILKPNTGAVGSTVTATGYGYGAGERVKVYWDNPLTLEGTTTANSSGTFSTTTALTFTIPSGAPPGINSVAGVGQTTRAIGTGYVQVK